MGAARTNFLRIGMVLGNVQFYRFPNGLGDAINRVNLDADHGRRSGEADILADVWPSPTAL